MEQLLGIQNVTKTFGKFVALDHVNFSVSKKEFVCLLGPSGCGKTTLLRIIAGLEEPNFGSKILLEGKDITSSPPSKRNFGIVFQSYALFPNLTAYQNIAYGLKNKKLSKKVIDEKVREALSLVHLEHIKDRYPAQLSGGQQQRIALARALALSPTFLLLDEPLSALDAKVRLKLRIEIRKLQEKLGITTIMVTHDQDEALTMADKIVVMNNARLEQIGTPQEIYENPKTPFVADFIGTVNMLAHEGTTAAIRPEHIQISETVSTNSIQTIVKAMEFRGAFYRLFLDITDPNYLVADGLLAVDVPASIIKKLNIDKESVLNAELPQNHLVTYA
ncbi:ATP-binding cassette domain-containing protein [Bacillus salipaludis]|uniref:Carnitine transport ATP-binding protein OpuCA n=1 Tax=Bacillus salipaludis TaxID=2547811 RepID=A0A4R5VSS0_9BACI|nr:ATP-binding cassette domain-containing protein [Bacillus salipaludis]TDK60880.1 ATP-binding cassette domain-containing protein [Bacillus salipaludis]